MYKSTYIVKDMDCPSEKSMIEMKLSELNNIIKNMDFDFSNRKLIIFHTEKDNKITSLLDELNLKSSLDNIEKIENKEFINDDSIQKKLLITVLAINFWFFILEFWFWLFSNSMWLIADSLDMLSDATIYFISLFAIWWTILMKKKIAKIAWIFQIILALLWISEVIRRFLNPELVIDFKFMIIISIFSFIWNYYSLYLFNKQNSCDAHMKASQICTSNDLIVNTWVILSWILVYLLWSNLPDLIIWIIIFIIVLRGSISILKLSK